MVSIIGAGLAGAEAAYQCARRGVPVTLYEQRQGDTMPHRVPFSTEAHRTGDFAELVCSNSLKSWEPTNAHGLLKAELGLLDSLLLRIAEQTQIPGGKALVVDRVEFARKVTETISGLPGVTVRREQVEIIPESGIVIIATGPLTSASLAKDLAVFLGTENLAFYDAISPIVSSETIDRAKSFAANRYIEGDDYLNCPLTEPEYDAFYDALVQAELFPLHEFECAREEGIGGRGSEIGVRGKGWGVREDSPLVPRPPPLVPRSLIPAFEGCMPIEEIARRGKQALLYGPMKPVGLIDPATGRQPFGVVQLRRENQAGTMFNLVGFQTRMTQPEQRRVLRMIPALAQADFLRYGSVHRNTFIAAPVCLKRTLQTQKRTSLFVAGQLSGVEGYVESIGTGLLAGINAARLVLGREPIVPPETTMLGGLLKYITTPRKHFQPMNANFGLLPVPRVRRPERPKAYAERAMTALREWNRDPEKEPQMHANER